MLFLLSDFPAVMSLSARGTFYFFTSSEKKNNSSYNTQNSGNRNIIILGLEDLHFLHLPYTFLSECVYSV